MISVEDNKIVFDSNVDLAVYEDSHKIVWVREHDFLIFSIDSDNNSECNNTILSSDNPLADAIFTAKEISQMYNIPYEIDSNILLL